MTDEVPTLNIFKNSYKYTNFNKWWQIQRCKC